jgi:hypothetical protein
MVGILSRMMHIRAKLETHGKVFGEALNAATFAGILAVKPLWIKLIAQTQCLVLFVQAR